MSHRGRFPIGPAGFKPVQHDSPVLLFEGISHKKPRMGVILFGIIPFGIRFKGRSLGKVLFRA